MLDTKAIKYQAAFCTELMKRLNADILKDECDKDIDYEGMVNHTQKQADIIRLRRELNRLKQMLNPWGDYYG